MRKFSLNWNLCKPVVCIVFAVVLQMTTLQAQNNLESRQALNLVKKNASSLGLSEQQLNDAIVSKAFHDRTLDADLVYLQQAYLGIPVFNSIKAIAFKNNQTASVSGSFVSMAANKAPKSAVATLKPLEAIAAAARFVNLTPPRTKAALKTESNGRKMEFDGLGISQENITTELMWVVGADNQLQLSWQVKILPIKSSDYWLINVNAATGVVSQKMNLTVYCNWDKPTELDGLNADNDEHFAPRHLHESAPPPPAINSAAYRVLPFPIESPSHGTFSLVNDPWLLAGAGNNATSLGWHNDGTTDFGSTRGNNVWAKEDRAGDNETTIGVSAISSTPQPNYTFDYTFNTTTTPTGSTNQSAAMTNLFYWNNIIHDITYKYGFDEVSGNFQNDNQGRGGLGGDYVLADAQDGSGSNNANFSTPVDGNRPRMQMFLFNPNSNTTIKINSPAGSAGFVQGFEVNVSSNNKIINVGPVTADVVLYDNGTNLGCTAAASGAFTGKIVLIARGGTCNAQPKIKNAQNGGAVGVILYNVDASPAGAFTTTTDNSVIIPSLVITNANGLALTAAINADVVNATMSGSNIDGDLDNGVIVHEYGHGISNRLTGGPANSSCLQNAEQMGEGWSDYYALMLVTDWTTATPLDGPNKRSIGTYAFGQAPTGPGIRTYPYSTNMTINPWTYANLASIPTNSSPHSRGEIWAATLWDMTWNIIAIDGINTNLYDVAGAGGNSVSMKLVTQGLKLQPCSPGFIDGRNAILKADTLLFGGRYSCAIWRSFARRGMGAGASQGSSASTTDQTATFTVPSFNYDTTVSVCNSFTWYDTTIKASGTYIRTVELPGGCSRTITLNLTILSVSSTFTKTDAGCFGSATGSITITPTSGVAPYTYRIGTVGAFGTSNTFNNLKAGNYRVSILDANGCAGISAQITIGQQPAITGTSTKTDAGCFGSATGSVTVTPTTGTGPYTYRLGTTGVFGNSNSFTSLKSGTYKVYIQDAGGCTGYVTVVIGQSAAITGTLSITNVTGCFGGTNGAISVTPTTGTGPHTYKLGVAGTFSSLSNFTGLRAGSYIIYIQDANGCIGSVSAAVTQPAVLRQTFAITRVTCNGGSDGTITVTGTGGTLPYSYRLGTSGAFSSTSVFTGLRAGSYRIYILDANGCAYNSSAVVTQATTVSLSVAKTNLTCFGSNDGTITLTGAGGTAPFTFRLGTVGGYSSTNTFTNLSPGTYRAYVLDANNCAGASVSIIIEQSINPCSPVGKDNISKTAITNSGKQLEVAISPNPSSVRFTLTTHAVSKTPVEIRVLDVNGKNVYATKGTANQTFRFGETLMTGTYLVEVRRGNEVKTVKAVKIR